MGDFDFKVNVKLGLESVVKKNAFKSFKDDTQETFKSFTGLESSSKLVANNVKSIEKGISKQLHIPIDELGTAFKRNNLVMKESGKIWDAQQNKFLTANQAMTKINKSTRIMDFGFLSLLFGGMALQRTFGGLFKTLNEGYKKLAGDNSEYLRSTEKLGGAFTFLKYTIFDAFANNSMVKVFMSKITEGLLKLGEFFNDHPNLGFTIVTFTGALALLGTAMVTIGQTITLHKATQTLSDLSKVIGDGTLAENVGGLTTKLKSFGTNISTIFTSATGASSVMMTLTNIIVLALVVGAVFSLWRTEVNDFLEGLGPIGEVIRIIGNILGMLFNFAKHGVSAIMKMVNGLFDIILEGLEILNFTLDLGWNIGSLSDLADTTEELNAMTSEYDKFKDYTKDNPVETAIKATDFVMPTGTNIEDLVKNATADVYNATASLTELDEEEARVLRVANAYDTLNESRNGASYNYSEGNVILGFTPQGN